MKYFCALVFALLTSSALAGTSNGYGMGGKFSRFDPVVAEHNRTGELFHIEGHCQSACTVFLGIKNVCVQPSARLLFHAGHDRQRNISTKWTNHMLAHTSRRSGNTWSPITTWTRSRSTPSPGAN
jgi:hypothetical protein